MAEHPSPCHAGAPWRFPQSSPHLSYPFTRRHLGEDKKWTACSDLSFPCSRKHSTAHSSVKGQLVPEIIHQNQCCALGSFLFQKWWWSATCAATFTKPHHHCQGTNFKVFVKGFSAVTNSNCAFPLTDYMLFSW